MSAVDAYFLAGRAIDAKHRPIRTALTHGNPGRYGMHYIND